MNIEVRFFDRVERTWGDKVRNALANFFTAGFWKDWKNEQLKQALVTGNYDAAQKAIVYGANRYHAFSLLKNSKESIQIQANIISFALSQFFHPDNNHKYNYNCYIENKIYIYWDHHKNNLFIDKFNIINDFVFGILPFYFEKSFELATAALGLLEHYKIVDVTQLTPVYNLVTSSSNCRCGGPNFPKLFKDYKTQLKNS